jgi:hypothetical protein
MNNIFKSRTIWIAIIQSLLSVAVVVLTEYDLVGYAGLLKSVVDIILRAITTTPLSEK